MKSVSKFLLTVLVLPAVGVLALTPSAAHAAAFTPGNIVVYRAGDGTAALGSAATAVFLDEYTTGGTLVQSIPLPTTSSGAINALLCSGSATSEGLLTRSTDGRYLVFGGYKSTVGTAAIAGTTAASTPRVVGRVDSSGNIDTSTALTDFASGNNPRSAVSTDGTAFWVAGAVTSPRYATLGASTSTQISTTVANLRQINIFNGQLYVSTSSGSAVRLGAVGTGLPTTSGQTIVNLSGFPASTGSPYGFFFCTLNGGANFDTVYVADDTAATGGIQKWCLVGGNWTLLGTITGAASVRGLTATVVGTTVTLFGTASGSIYKAIDSAGYNAAPSSTAVSTIAAAAANTAFRGIAFAPGVDCTTPIAFNTTGGDGCTASGVTIGLDNSQSGVNYQLFNGASTVGSFLAGSDGSAISFGLQTAAGNYTVTATNTSGNCTAAMNGSVTITTTVTPSVTVVQSPGGSVCTSSTVIFTATPVNGGTPTYVWKTNGTVVADVTGSVFTLTAPVDGEAIDCEMTSTATCASPATADATQITLSVTASVNPSVSITVNPSATICAGSPVAFTAAPVNGGTPAYQWNTNGVPVTGETEATFTTSGLQNGDVVTVVMTSTDPCRSTDTTTSSPITMAVNLLLTPSVTIGVSPSSTICSNTSATFTATPVNGGAAPTYQWKTNGTSVTGATSSTYVTTLLKNGDVVSVVMTPSSEICLSAPTATSNGITMTVNPNLTPSVTVAASPSGAICSGTPVTFTATPVNGGVSPTFQWKTNGVTVTGATSSTYSSGTLINSDSIICVLTPSPDICVSPATATSSPITMIVNTFDLATSFASEDFGTTGSSLPAGWSATSAATAWVVGASAVSSGYSGASGGNNVSITTGGDPATYLVSSTINCSALTSGGVLTFGLRKSSASFNKDLVIDVSTDNGVTWTAFTATILNASMASGSWGLQTVNLGSVINNQAQVVIRWHLATSGGSGTSNVRLDDIKLTATPETMAVITASGPTTFCAGGSVTLTANAGGSSYVWSTGETTPSITINASGAYTVTIFDANTCSSSASETVTVHALPTVSLNSTTICAGDSTTLTATTDASNPTYLWSPGGATAASINVSPTATTLYTVAVTDGTTGCENSASGTVTVNPLPTVSVSSATVCAGGSATLTATTSASNPSYLWSPGGATTASITVSPIVTTIYSVTVTDGTTSCANSGTGTVTFHPLPTVTVVPATTNVECAGAVIFTADPAGDGPLTYQWYDNQTNAIAGETNLTLTLTNIHGAAAGNYTVLVTGPFCSASAVASLTVADTLAPALTILGANPATNECHVTYTDAGATASDACVGDVGVVTNSTVDANVPGVYTVTYTSDDGNGNTNTATRTVYVVDTIAPTLTILGANPATNECHVTYTDAGATASDACVGSVGATTSGNVDANTPGSYLVTYTAGDGNGNTNTATRTVYVVDTIAPAISVFGANPYTNFAYVPFVDPGATAVDACDVSALVTTNGTVDVTTPGDYVLEYIGTDASGNSATNTRTVIVVALASPTIASGQKLDGGAFEVTFSGLDGQPYQLLTTTDVTLKMSSWTVLTTGTFGDTPMTYTDDTATNDSVRFYRIVSP